MKKIISVFLILTMILSVVCVSASAADGMLMQSNFADENTTYAQFALGDYYCDPAEGMIIGYSSARALQTRYDDENLGENPYGWVTYDLSVNMALAEDSLAVGDRAIHLTHCNTAHIDAGISETTEYMAFSYDITNAQFYISSGNLGINADNILAGPVDYELTCDGSEFYTFGLSISENRIRGFLNGELILEYVDESGYYMLGQDHPNPQVVWNDNNMVMIKEYKVSTAGYMFPLQGEETTTAEPVPTETTQGDDEPTPTETTTQGGDEPTPGTTTGKVEDPADSNNDPADTNKPADADKPADTNNTGNQQKPADTNTNKPAGGSSTATGDSAFVVVAAMVAALGCALIVKKVNVK